jgi:FkbM family methyltransferase
MRILILKLIKSLSLGFKIPYAGDQLMLLINKTGIWNNVELPVTTSSGIKMFLTLKDWVQKNIFLYGYYEKKETFFWNHITKNKVVVFDVGANVGYFSLMAAKQIADQGRVYGFEPVSFVYQRAKYNCDLNNFKNITISNIAISDKAGEITINVGNDENLGMSGINHHNYLSGKSEKVKTNTIDNFIADNKISQLDVIKIDVEGSEFFVLKGMNDALEKYKPTILIEILDALLEKSGSSKEEIYNFLWSRNFEAYKIISGEKIEPILTPKSFDGLTLFKHKDKPFDEFVKIIA